MSGEQVDSPTASDSHRAVPAPFLTKTYKLVEDPETDDIVSWGEDNCTFVVWRPSEFARDLLPNYFKHNNFSSFVRQLNTYGFRKVVPDRWEFANEFFRRGEKRLLCEIHRRKTVSTFRQAEHCREVPRSLSPSCSADDAASPLPSPAVSPRSHVEHTATVREQAYAREQAVSVCDENDRLRRDNALLAAEVSRLRHSYEEALLILQRHLQHQRYLPFPSHETADRKINTVSVRQVPALGCEPLKKPCFGSNLLPIKVPQVRNSIGWSPSGGAFTSFQPLPAVPTPAGTPPKRVLANTPTTVAALMLPYGDGKIRQLVGSPPVMMADREAPPRPAPPNCPVPQQVPVHTDNEAVEERTSHQQQRKGFRLFGVPVQERPAYLPESGNEIEPPTKRMCHVGSMERSCYTETNAQQA